MIRLETERLLLRPLHMDDRQGFVPLLNNWDVARWLARVPHPYEEKHFTGILKVQEERMAEGHEPGLAIQIKQGPPHAVGMVGVHPERSDEAEAAAIGFWIGEPFWGKGYMSEAVEAVLADASARRGFRVIEAGYLDGNQGSARVLEKAGFQVTGHGLDYSLANDAELPATFVRLELTAS